MSSEILYPRITRTGGAALAKKLLIESTLIEKDKFGRKTIVNY